MPRDAPTLALISRRRGAAGPLPDWPRRNSMPLSPDQRLGPARSAQSPHPAGVAPAAWAQPRGRAAVAAAIGPCRVARRADERCLVAGADRRAGRPVRAATRSPAWPTGAASSWRWRARSTASRASGEPALLLTLDIDHFKKVNDTHGHAAGDLVIQAVARALAETVRPMDLVARVGGEEFSIVAAQLPACVRPAGGRAHSQARRAPSGGDCAGRVGGRHGERGRCVRAAMGAHHGTPVDGSHRPAAVSRQERRAQPLLPRADRRAVGERRRKGLLFASSSFQDPDMKPPSHPTPSTAAAGASRDRRRPASPPSPAARAASARPSSPPTWPPRWRARASACWCSMPTSGWPTSTCVLNLYPKLTLHDVFTGQTRLDDADPAGARRLLGAAGRLGTDRVFAPDAHGARPAAGRDPRASRPRFDRVAARHRRRHLRCRAVHRLAGRRGVDRCHAGADRR